MGFNVSTATMFEKNDSLRSNAKTILDNAGASKEAVSRVISSTIFDNEAYVSSYNPQLSIIKAATQISVNSTLNETLKYLRTHGNKKQAKTPVFGELWNIASVNNEESDKNQYKGELIDFTIDNNIKNIFAA